MEPFMFIDDPKTLKALAHPIRLRLLNRLIAGEASVQQLANEFSEVHAKLFYHVRELAQCNVIECVGEQTKNGITERFYRARARSYVLGQTVGPGPEALKPNLQEAALADLLKWRRQEELGIDYRAVARMLVRDALGFLPGQTMIVEGTTYQKDLLQAVVVEARAQGGEAYIRLMSQEVVLETLEALTLEQLQTPPPLSLQLGRLVDYWLSFDSIASAAELRSIPREKLQALIAGESSLYRPENKRYANVIVGYPTPERASELGLNYATLYDTFWRAISINPGDLAERGATLANTLGQEVTARVTSAHGSRLTFRTVPGRRVLLHNGTMSSAVTSPLSVVDLSLPAGQVICAPLEESAQGVLVIPELKYQGRTARMATVAISRGTITSYSAEENEEVVRELIGLASNADIGTISFGINPHVTGVCGYKYLDPIGEGNMTVSLGGNTHLGGSHQGLVPVSLTVSSCCLFIGN